MTTNLQIYKDKTEILDTLLTNVVKMLVYRKWLNNVSDIKTFINNLKKKTNEKIYTIQLSTNLMDIETYEQFENKTKWKKFDGSVVVVYILNQKLTGKTQPLSEFLNRYENVHKIVIFDDMLDKYKNSVLSEKFLEFFKEKELMINIADHKACPIFEVLSSDEREEMMDTYNVIKKEIPKQFDLDPMSRYLYVKQEQILRIISNSPISGQVVNYRIVIGKGGKLKMNIK